MKFQSLGTGTGVKGAVGARVIYCGHAGYFLADISVVAGAAVVRANGKVTPGNLVRDDRFGAATHRVSDVEGGFWRPDLGVFVVPVGQVQEVAVEALCSR